MKHIKKKESSTVYYTYWQYILWIICYNKSITVCNVAKMSGSLSPWLGLSSGCGWRNGLQYGGCLWMYWLSSRRQLTRDSTPA